MDHARKYSDLNKSARVRVRMLFSLTAAWLAGSLTFGIAWLRLSDWESSFFVVRHVLYEYGLLIGIFVIVVGLPDYTAPATAADVWGSVAFGAIVGGLMGAAFWYVYARRPRPDNPVPR